MTTIDRSAAVRLLEALPTYTPSLEPCHDVNPALWLVWCDVKRRIDDTSPSVWAEIDVVASSVLMISKHMRLSVKGDNDL